MATFVSPKTGDPDRRWVVFDGETPIVIGAAEPVAFLALARADFVRAVTVASQEFGSIPVDLQFAKLPVGYEVVLAPYFVPLGLQTGTLTVGSAADVEDAKVQVSPIDPLADTFPISSTLTSADVNGIQGWAPRAVRTPP